MHEEQLSALRAAVERLRARRAPTSPAGDDPVGFVLLTALDALPPPQRLAYTLDLLGVPFERIARVLRTTPDAARRLAERAAEQLHP